jgi:hypothetical protein
VPQLPRQYREHKKLAPSYDIARNITIQVVYFDMKIPTSEVMAATRRLRNVGARMFVVQGNLTGATTKDFIRAVPAKKTACALKFLKRFGVPINDFFEHLSETIAEATPFYELCASVLDF